MLIIFTFIKKINKGIKDRTLRDIRNLFENEEEQENYYKPVRVSNFWSNDYIENEGKDDRNKPPSFKEYFNKLKPFKLVHIEYSPYLKDIINNLKHFDMSKIQLTIAINFIFSKDKYEEHVMHSKSDNTKIMINDEADKVIKKLFKSL